MEDRSYPLVVGKALTEATSNGISYRAGHHKQHGRLANRAECAFGSNEARLSDEGRFASSSRLAMMLDGIVSQGSLGGVDGRRTDLVLEGVG
jgi:hypothetical protein